MVTTRSAERKRDDLVLRAKPTQREAPIQTPTRSKRVKVQIDLPDEVSKKPDAFPSRSDAITNRSQAIHQEIAILDITSTPVSTSTNRDVFRTPATSLRTSIVNHDDAPNTASTDSSAMHDYHTADEGESDSSPEVLNAKPAQLTRGKRRKAKGASAVPVESSLDSPTDKDLSNAVETVLDGQESSGGLTTDFLVREYAEAANEDAMDLDDRDPGMALFKFEVDERQTEQSMQVNNPSNDTINIMRKFAADTSDIRTTNKLPRRKGNSFEQFRQRKLRRHRIQSTWSSERSVFVVGRS